MSSSEKKTEELLDKVILDVKAFVLLHGTDADLKTKLDRKLKDSQDESIRRFVNALQVGANPEPGRLFTIALGELILASFLVVAGILILVPIVVGVNTPAALIQYFAARAYGTMGASPLGQYVTFVQFAVGTMLMLSAFYSLRHGALHLKEMGLSIKSGET
ncbi:MAG: hypothetical protein OK404_02860 [Thaumarchaeota archaeon]|nr:hypothetical protein [Nitrososphaerota archaeon]